MSERILGARDIAIKLFDDLIKDLDRRGVRRRVRDEVGQIANVTMDRLTPGRSTSAEAPLPPEEEDPISRIP
jgi:hypothetical protein